MKTAFGLGIMVGVTGLLMLQHFPVLARIHPSPPSAPPNIRSDAANPSFCPPPGLVCK
jgi:hypothetical protein